MPLTSPVVGNTAVPLYSGGLYDSVMFYNTDENNPVVISDAQSVSALSSDANTLNPLGSFTLDGKSNWYGVCPVAGETAQIDVAPGGSNFAPSPAQIIDQLIASTLPSLIADAIQAAGVPAIDDPGLIDVNFNQTIAAGGTYQTPWIAVGKWQSWLATMFATATSAGTGTNPFTKIHMAWGMTVDNDDPLHVEDWVVPNTPYNFFYNYRNDGQGPVYGDALSITFTNYDTQPVNVTFGIFGSYRSRIRSVLRGRYAWNSDGSPNDAAGMGSDSIITSYNAGAIGVGSVSSPALMNLFNGPVTVSASVTGAAAAQTWDVRITPQPTSILASTIVCTNDTLNRLNPRTVMLPRRVCSVFVGNGGGNALTSAQVVITAQEQPE